MDAQLVHLASLPDNFPIPVIELALLEAILSPNPAATAAFPDLPTVGLAHPAVQKLAALAAQMHTTGVNVVTREVQVDATRFHQLIVSLPDQQKLRVYMLDVTPHPGHDAQIQHAHLMEAIGRLAEGVAHHFNTLLTIILGYAELLEEEFALASPDADKVQAIKQAGERAAALVRQLFAFSRQMHLEPQVMQLNTLIGTLATRLRSLLGTDIDLTTILDPHLGWVEADPQQIEQAIMHLVVNAREAMPTGGHLTIETRNVELDRCEAQPHRGVRPDPYVLVAVRDTGCGMDATTQTQMFEPFFTTKPVGQGTGLNLATVYGTITQSGGHLEVSSTVGQGTTVTFYLPCLQPDVQLPPVESGTLRLPHGTETIVLVTVEPGGRTWARRTLEACGYAVLDANTGKDALELIEHSGQPVHVLVTEVVLPGMTGPQLAAQVTARYAAVKLLYIADSLEEADAQGLGTRGVVILQKPVTPALLAQQVREDP